MWWRHDLSPEELNRSTGTQQCDRKSAISTKLLELLGMLITPWVMVVVAGDRSEHDNDLVYFQGDNTLAVTWVNRCGGTHHPRAAALMRLLGVLELQRD